MTFSSPDDNLRVDARRNRERIMVAAGELFARHGNAAQMDQIATHAGLGMGTLYRHFPNKQVLVTAIVRERFRGMTDLARSAEAIADPGEAFAEVLRRYLEAAEGDAALQLAVLGSIDFDWDGIEDQKVEFIAIVNRIIARAAAANAIRADLTFSDFLVTTVGVMSTMYFQPGDDNPDWRRHLDLLLSGLRAR